MSTHRSESSELKGEVNSSKYSSITPHTMRIGDKDKLRVNHKYSNTLIPTLTVPDSKQSSQVSFMSRRLKADNSFISPKPVISPLTFRTIEH